MSDAAYVCPNGHAVAPPEKPEGYIPEPDRHGNVRVQMTCDKCGESQTAVLPKHGGVQVEAGWETID